MYTKKYFQNINSLDIHTLLCVAKYLGGIILFEQLLYPDYVVATRQTQHSQYCTLLYFTNSSLKEFTSLFITLLMFAYHIYGSYHHTRHIHTNI